MLDVNKSVLIVDDMSSARQIVIKTVKTMGFTEIIQASNGLEAIDAMKDAKVPVGLIICDWRMPPYTGLDFLKMLKANPRTNTIPFLMVTSESDKKDIFEVINAGADGYLLKPFTAEVLVKKINAITK